MRKKAKKGAEPPPITGIKFVPPLAALLVAYVAYRYISVYEAPISNRSVESVNATKATFARRVRPFQDKRLADVFKDSIEAQITPTESLST